MLRYKRTFFVWKYLSAIIVILLIASCGQGNGSSGELDQAETGFSGELDQEETPASGTTVIDQNSALDINTFGTIASSGERMLQRLYILVVPPQSAIVILIRTGMRGATAIFGKILSLWMSLIQIH